MIAVVLMSFPFIADSRYLLFYEELQYRHFLLFYLFSMSEPAIKNGPWVLYGEGHQPRYYLRPFRIVQRGKEACSLLQRRLGVATRAGAGRGRGGRGGGVSEITLWHKEKKVKLRLLLYIFDAYFLFFLFGTSRIFAHNIHETMFCLDCSLFSTEGMHAQHG